MGGREKLIDECQALLAYLNHKIMFSEMLSLFLCVFPTTLRFPGTESIPISSKPDTMLSTENARHWSQ